MRYSAIVAIACAFIYPSGWLMQMRAVGGDRCSFNAQTHSLEMLVAPLGTHHQVKINVFIMSCVNVHTCVYRSYRVVTPNFCAHGKPRAAAVTGELLRLFSEAAISIPPYESVHANLLLEACCEIILVLSLLTILVKLVMDNYCSFSVWRVRNNNTPLLLLSTFLQLIRNSAMILLLLQR